MTKLILGNNYQKNKFKKVPLQLINGKGLMVKIKEFWEILKEASIGFNRHKVLKLSASLAYYTVFSLGPMMLVIIFFSDIFWGRQAIEGTIYNHISGFVGNAAAIQIQEIIKNASITGNNVMAVISFVILLIAATTVFTEMQDSINMIWNLEVKHDKGWHQLIKSRLLSFSIVTGLGFLLLVSLIITGIMEGFMGNLQKMFPFMAIIVVYVINMVLTLLVVALLFAIIYKLLPDAIIQWKDVFAGAVFASGLFMIGKFCLSFYINNSNIGSAYGSAGSLVILLLWVYYSAAILYFGAEFTKAFALKYGSEIKPKSYALTVQIIRIESDEPSIQQNEKDVEATELVVKKIHDELKSDEENLINPN